MVEGLSSADVLVVVDMQNIFAEGAGIWQCEGYRLAQANVEKLRAGFPGTVVLTKFVADPDEHGAWRAYYDTYPSARLPATDPAWDLTIDVNPGDTVVAAGTFSKWGPQLRALVPQHARIIMAGVATDCCIVSTALGAIDDGREVLIVEDACAGSSVENHTKTLEILALLGPLITVRSIADLLGGS